MNRFHWQQHCVRAVLVPRHCGGLHPVVSYYGYGEIGPPPHRDYDYRTVAERERDLYEQVMREGAA